MDRRYIRKLDETEQRRTRAIQEKWSTKNLDVEEIYKSDEVRGRIHENRPAFLSDQYNIHDICLTLPFYESIVAEVCSHCPCTTKPELILPMLENEVIVPALVSRYSDYPKKFISEVMQYPHISRYELSTLQLVAIQRREGEAGTICPHCVRKMLDESESLLGNYPKRKATFYMRGLKYLAPKEVPVFGVETWLFEDAVSSIASNNEERFRQVVNMARCVDGFRTATGLNGVLQVPMDLEDTITAIESKYPQLGLPTEETGITRAVAEGLSLSYEPGMRLDKYLEIVLPRRKRIASVISSISSKAQGEHSLTKVQQELEEVNNEIRRISRSSRGMVVEYATGLINGNQNVISRCLVGAALGFMFAGPLGGFAGAVGTSLASRIAEETHLPPSRFQLSKKITDILEPGYHRVLAHVLSSEPKYIQLWQLRRKLKSLASGKDSKGQGGVESRS